MFNQLDTIDQFNQAIAASGIKTSYKVKGTVFKMQDNKTVERFKIDGDEGKSGWAILYLDKIPAGSFGSWKTGEKHTWCSVDRKQLSPQDRVAVNRLLAEAEKKRSQELNRIQKIAASKAFKMLADASPATDHPYLTSKRVGAYTSRLFSRVNNSLLLISVEDANGITSVQMISEDGRKQFLPHGRMKGCYHLIGHPEGVTYITEGWATGCTIHALTGRPVVVAFNAGNLSATALGVRVRYPKARFLIAADNDQWGTNNTGLSAAKGTELPIVVPIFQPCDTKPTDFNDLFVLEGADVARNQLTPPAMPETLPIVAESLPEQWVALPDVRGDKEKPISTINNLKEVLRRLDVTVRYNVISKQEEMLIPNLVCTVDNRANASLAWIESQCAIYNMPTDKTGQFLTYIADGNPYNPVAAWIESKPWDGVSRIEALGNTVTILGGDEDESRVAYKHIIIKRWLVSAVAGAYRHNGISAQGVLVFQGNQALGKTMWFKRLADTSLIADGVTLDLKDKDSQLNALGFWLVELGELDATFRKTDIAQLKSFITRDKDVIRVAYAKRKSEYARRTVFFASVNEQEFLHDSTGNRRFWTIQCESIDYTHKINMQQLWAEVLHLYKAGERWTLSHHELEELTRMNRSFEAVDDVEDALKTLFSWESPISTWRKLTATEIGALMGYSGYIPAMKISRFVKKLNGNKIQRTGSKRLLSIPELRSK